MIISSSFLLLAIALVNNVIKITTEDHFNKYMHCITNQSNHELMIANCANLNKLFDLRIKRVRDMAD